MQIETYVNLKLDQLPEIYLVSCRLAEMQHKLDFGCCLLPPMLLRGASCRGLICCGHLNTGSRVAVK